MDVDDLGIDLDIATRMFRAEVQSRSLPVTLRTKNLANLVFDDQVDIEITSSFIRISNSLMEISEVLEDAWEDNIRDLET